MNNISTYSDCTTAKTCNECALQRAENLFILGVRNVLELCVGPSLKILEECYSKFNIKVTGNDIDPRWRDFYPKGSWIIGDAKTINTKGFDAVVVAPPLSKGCSGKREDSLSLDEVIPSYYDFITVDSPIIAYVLPGRTLSTKKDREQLYRFLSSLKDRTEIVCLKNKVTKYVDLYRIRNV